jgi:hypothetical protein
MTYSIHLNKLEFANGDEVSFEHPIKEVFETNKVLIVTIEPESTKTIYNNNAFAFSISGDFLWRIGDVELYYRGEHCLYVGATVNADKELVLFNWRDTAVIIEPETGEMIRTYQTK